MLSSQNETNTTTGMIYPFETRLYLKVGCAATLEMSIFLCRAESGTVFDDMRNSTFQINNSHTGKKNTLRTHRYNATLKQS